LSVTSAHRSFRRAASAARRRTWWRNLLVLLGIACSLASPARVAHAQLAVDQVDLVFERGARMPSRQAFTVTNNGKKTAQADILLADWDRDSVGNNRFYPYGTLAGSCGRALSIDPASASLDSGASQLVQVRVDTAALPRGECWAVAFVQSRLPSARRGSHFNLIVRTGVKLYVVLMAASRAGEILALQVRPHVPPRRPDSVLVRLSPTDSGHMEPLPPDSAHAAAVDTARQELVLGFANSGTRHLVARGSLELRRPDNSVAARLTLPSVYTLPGTTQRLTVPLPNVARGRYVALAILDFGGDELAAGQVEFDTP
jgi:P pilus assembly chaperone PapD